LDIIIWKEMDFGECPSILSSDEKAGCLFKERKIG
jgi:hypothetical protein